MKKTILIKFAGLAAAVLAVTLLAAIVANDHAAESHIGWPSLIPPIVAIVLAFLTHHVLLSLGAAVLIGALLTKLPAAPANPEAWVNGIGAAVGVLQDTIRDKTNLLIIAFIPPIFTMIEIVIAAGGFQAIVLWLLRRVRGKIAAQLATASMGLLCFIDDYANAIIVGSMMRPITDRFRISRQKLAFLVDATSAPVSGLAIISTWIAYEIKLFADVAGRLGIERTGYAMFFDALRFRFYCLLMIGFVFLHVLMRRDFGPMKSAETSAESGEAYPDLDPNVPPADASRGLALTALLPLGGLLLFHLTGLWIDGGGPTMILRGASPANLPYWRDVISNAEHSHMCLMLAALFGMGLALICAGAAETTVLATLRCFGRGLKRAIMPTFVLVFAWSLKNCCDQLGTGQYLSTMLADRVPSWCFGPIVFVAASLTSFATGTSWGTMAILIPAAVPTAFALDGESYGATTMITLAAVLDGAIFGDHCSPISDTTIISSTASSCKLMEHVRTQLPYSLFVALVALLAAYVPASLGLAAHWSLALALLAIVGTLRILPGRRT